MGFDVKRLDIYRKVPKDLTQPTLTGAVISVLCCSAIAFLLVSELYAFLQTEIISEVYVDNPGGGDDSRIAVSVTVELPNLKCEYIGIDIQDDMGRHEVGFVDDTVKTPIGPGEQGCIFHSKFKINKVPGNFHISTHSARSQPENADFTHVIKEIRLGDKIVANVPGSFNPLAGASKKNEHGIESHDYIMKIVPTIFESYAGKTTISYQYTYVYRTFVGRGSSAIWFRYDLSPLTVRYKEKGEAFFSFLTAICAVVGGVFTVATMIDGLIFSASELYKKFEIGKLS